MYLIKQFLLLLLFLGIQLNFSIRITKTTMANVFVSCFVLWQRVNKETMQSHHFCFVPKRCWLIVFVESDFMLYSLSIVIFGMANYSAAVLVKETVPKV